MDILIGIVIAFIIITAVFVGYNYSQKPAEVGGHEFPIEAQTSVHNFESIQVLNNFELISPKQII